MTKPFSGNSGIRAHNSGSNSPTGAGQAEALSFEEVEERFKEIMRGPLIQTVEIGDADIVVGIPFYNEADTIASVLKTVRKGLEEFYPDQKCVIVAAGSPVGGEALRAIDAVPRSEKINRIVFLLDDELLDGKGWSIRAIMEIADKLGADLALLEADLKSRSVNGEIEGLSSEWIRLMLEPVKSGEMDMVISRFNRHYLEAPVSTLTYPLFTAIYNCPIRRLTGGQWGIAHHLFRTYLSDARYVWRTHISGYGVDAWLATIAITNNARICEAPLGIKIRQRSGAKAELVLRHVAQVFLEQIMNDSEWWEQPGANREVPLRKPLPSFGIPKAHRPDAVEINPQLRIIKCQEGFNKFHRLYERVFPLEAYRQLAELAETDLRSFRFPANLWAQTVYHLILAYAFSNEFARDDIWNALIPLHHGFEGSAALALQALKADLESVSPEVADRLLYMESEHMVEEMVNEFLRQKPAFISNWEEKAEALKPPVPQITYREFIPGVPLIVPSELTTPKSDIILANDIYHSIFERQKAEFEHFVYERLKVPREASSREITLAIKDFLHSVESETLPGRDLSTVEGTKETVMAIFDNFPHEDTFSLTPEMVSWLLSHKPPFTLLTKWGYGSLSEMLEDYDPLDVLALANWSEEREYIQSLWKLVAENVRPDHFTASPVKPVVVSEEDFPSLVEMRGSSSLDKLTSRIVVSNLHKGMGGEFPKLRYLTTITKNMVEAERFGQVWRKFADEGKDFGRKVVDSLEGHWGKEPLSAHSIFEDGHQRILVERVRQMAWRIAQETDKDSTSVARAGNLKALAESYYLALTLPDGAFVTCSVWSWASYSFKGGRSSPTPLSLHVERDWASREFLVEYYKAAGGSEAEVEEKVIELMGQGREWEDLAPILLGEEKGVEEVIPWTTITPDTAQSVAGTLTRFSGNPIIEPVKEHPWESKYVLNAGAIKLNAKVYLVYRAYGEDETSRLGLAVSDDGFKFTERLDTPIFGPKGKSEEKGCEDPRLTLIGDRIYMLYTAFGKTAAQIALASIGVKAFSNHQWQDWRRHGLVFPKFTDKDAALFPEQFKGKFAMLHRLDPHVWITFSPHLSCPWPRKEHRILAGTTTGMMWDGRKIGAGAQPIKTEFGWLLITHGVDYAHVYRLGVMLLDLTDPSKLIYRSPNFILEPEEEYEIGGDAKSWVPNVVFTCGAIPREDKDILDADDEILVYYGAADTVISVATAKVGELIPTETR